MQIISRASKLSSAEHEIDIDMPAVIVSGINFLPSSVEQDFFFFNCFSVFIYILIVPTCFFFLNALIS